jgi:hypothetical protein
MAELAAESSGPQVAVAAGVLHVQRLEDFWRVPVSAAMALITQA